ncbi:uncharacterized protein LOC110825484 [Carica papaya]|uniref:uncharacterized protein LOC110825484 n=1 Tax=Carica papaya TaxID=3649 RepID=UPI000B8CA98F|nr:uncharacterized protein LOC110825484 [Carica papaya]
MAVSGSDSQAPNTKVSPSTTSTTTEVESVKCDSCGFTEDCTPAYIRRVRDRYEGRWICGLCIEAVKDEVLRSNTLISTEEALRRHINFFKKFRSSTPIDGAEHPISVLCRILRRSLDTPTALRSNSSSSLIPIQSVKGSGLVRSESCFPSLSR